MSRHDLPVFPAFAWHDYFWVTSARLPAWSGYQIRNGPYGAVGAEGLSDGTVQLLFAPEGRDDAPLKDSEVNLVRWVIENEAAVHEAMIQRLFDEYPKFREEAIGWFDEDEANRLLPEVHSPEGLKKLVGIVSINVHQIAKGGMPYIGIELGCTWEVEHGVGILLHGSTPLEIGGADTAILLWIAKKHAAQP